MTDFENVPLTVIREMRQHALDQLMDWRRSAQDADAAVARAERMIVYWSEELDTLEAAHGQKSAEVW